MKRSITKKSCYTNRWSYLIIFHFAIFFFHDSLGQQTKVPIVSPVSPEAAALFKTLDRPIGNYTGTVPVNFPLFTISSGDISVPISLDYNSTGGIRVEEVASSIGLGFNLNAGGRITRIQRGGISDDIPVYGYLYNAIKPSNFSTATPAHLIGFQANQIDLEPDLFMYSFNGQSGKFFFNEQGEVVMMQESDIKVAYSRDSNGIIDWTLTDGKGNKYVFGPKEQTVSTVNVFGGGTAPNPSAYYSSWLLYNIKDMNDQNVISFEYNSGVSGFDVFSGGFMKVQSNYVTDCETVYQQEFIVNTQIHECIPKKITGSNGYVLFNSTQDRADLGGGTRMRSIAVYDPTGNLKKTYKLNQFYTGSGFAADKRLMLANFSEFGSSGTDSLTYKFDYEPFVTMPNRLSRSVDFWGFYNGQYNTTYFPNCISTYYGVTANLTNLANRYCSPGYAKANILNKITYPTGGTRTFIYEGNTALNPGEQLTPDPAYDVYRNFTRSDFTNGGPTLPSLRQLFTINSTNGQANFKYNISINYCSASYSVKIYRLLVPGDLYGGFLIQTFNNSYNNKWDLPNGNYRLEVYKDNACLFNSITGSWQESTMSNVGVTTPYGNFTKNNRLVGGLRVKEIRDYDPVSGKNNSTTYMYKMYSTDSTLTSGFLNTPVRIMNEFNNDCNSCMYMRLYTTSCYPLANDGGSYVVYPEVRTIEAGNGYTDCKYSYAPDALPPVTQYPVMPLSMEQSKVRGKLLSKKIYAQNGTLLKENYSWYGYLPLGSPMKKSAMGSILTLYYTHGLINCRDYPATPGAAPFMARRTNYYISGGIYGLTATFEKTYGTAGDQLISTTYSYDTLYNDRPLVKQVKTTINNGTTREVNYVYAFNNVTDFKFGLTAPEQTMKATLLGRNYLLPLEVNNTLTASGGTPLLTGGVKYTFGAWYTNKLYLSGYKNYTSALDYKETIFSNYDGNGNLVEKYQPGGFKEVYLWGYNQAYPVAKIIGSDYATVSALANPAILNNPVNDAALNTHLGIIRASLPNAMMSSFTYSPLSGMSTSTDSKGISVFYEYDDFLRLKLIKNSDGHIVKSYQYNYKH